MSEALYEVAFSGQIRDGADAGEVRARVGKMFNADAAKIAQLFSGKRIVIKKNIDQATAQKYQSALNRAGAECEVRPMGGGGAAAAASTPPEASAAAPVENPPEAAATATASASVFETGDYGEVAPPPQTDPLGITGEQIEDLAVSIAPVGSELQNEYREAEAPEIDVSGFDVAPVGSELSTAAKKPDPPPPDTTGISLAD